jgi:hypothetical protein
LIGIAILGLYGGRSAAHRHFDRTMGVWLCGEVNAHNEFGGYTGWQGFATFVAASMTAPLIGCANTGRFCPAGMARVSACSARFSALSS